MKDAITTNTQQSARPRPKASGLVKSAGYTHHRLAIRGHTVGILSNSTQGCGDALDRYCMQFTGHNNFVSPKFFRRQSLRNGEAQEAAQETLRYDSVWEVGLLARPQTKPAFNPFLSYRHPAITQRNPDGRHTTGRLFESLHASGKHHRPPFNVGRFLPWLWVSTQVNPFVSSSASRGNGPHPTNSR